ncbi:MAG: hypothetical protein KKD46_00700 [Euryarchaeota archaeon]|nr:hypothetical protein [Euryarchaeota archaeon]MBU4339428.1 hypothetical protein [Euryarchaeota archaeon]
MRSLKAVRAQAAKLKREATAIPHGGRARNSENLKNETPVIMDIYVVYYNTIK